MRPPLKNLLGTQNISEHANPLMTIRTGIRTDAVARIIKNTGIHKGDLLKAIGITDKTYTRRIADKKLKEAESDRLYAFTKVLAHAIAVFGSQPKAKTWLYTPRSVLENEKPIDVCHTIQGLQQVDDMLYKIQHGMFS